MLAVVIAAEDSTRLILPHGPELLLGTVAFVLLMAALLPKVMPKMQQTLAARTARIRESIEAADNQKQEAERLLNEYRRQLAEARGDAQKIIDEARKTAESMRQDLIRRAEAEAQEIVQRAKSDVTAERDRALQDLRTTIGDLSIDLATRVIERELASPEAQRAMVERAIDELSTMGNGNR
jgi:F-type H+-transporting ATPase subunit b